MWWFNTSSTLSIQNQIEVELQLQALSYIIALVQDIVFACCDVISQSIIVRINHSSCIFHPFYSPKSSKIYRCWIVWGKNIGVVIIPLFLAITFLGQSTYLYLMSSLQFIAYSYLASAILRRYFRQIE